ncbi:MAG: GIY-YIG nuclease family protein [Bacteroidetes bacterium]|nr:GIY-YIG nuclease family protein [Bacteroidota bacterium]
MPLPFCVYILFSEKDKLLYTGYTSNIEQRIINHNSGGAISTRNRTLLKLIFVNFIYLKKMPEREKNILKQTWGKKLLNLCLRILF